MSVASAESGQPENNGEQIRDAVALLSQQLWCWGQDVLRAEGNWLLEVGFTRRSPPEEREECSSVYTLQLPGRRSVILRGFGVLFCDDGRGAVFLPRYEFRPRYTVHAALLKPPWSSEDLPALHPPVPTERSDCASLTLELIEWIRTYEVRVVESLGIDYRRETLVKWDNGKNLITPAEKFASAWLDLSFKVSANFDAYSWPDDD